MTLIAELKWRGLLQDVHPELEDFLEANKTTVYLGSDPTADSLHIGNLVPIMMLKQFQLYGHKPILLVGGATGMVGDPSGKSAERNLLTLERIGENSAGIQRQLERFLDNDCGDTSVELVNNYDWTKDISFLDFIREVGKYITVNYMMAKDSVKSRLSRDGAGLSFTEFTYQLLQGFDFYHLYTTQNCKVQIGGSDQWGNITTGTELIRKKVGGRAYGATCPLITKADGSKFGKSEGGNVWLSAERTSPYKFYQYWLNMSDEDAARFIRIFTLLPQTTIEAFETEHAEMPHKRLLQKRLAEDITTRVHGQAAYEQAIRTSQILFGKGTKDTLLAMSERDLLEVFAGVPIFHISPQSLAQSIPIIDFLAAETAIYQSKGEVRRALKGNSVSINKEKIKAQTHAITTADLLNDKYILVQKGKKNYNLVVVGKK